MTMARGSFNRLSTFIVSSLTFFLLIIYCWFGPNLALLPSVADYISSFSLEQRSLEPQSLGPSSNDTVIIGQDLSAASLSIEFNGTTCSRTAFHRGSGQKVVAFSFYKAVEGSGMKSDRYFGGIESNLNLVTKHYPGWIMRLYHDLEDNDPLMVRLYNLVSANNNLDLCNARNLPGTPMVDSTKAFPMNWRFFPTLDPQVDVLSSRDLDSRISEREVAAVKEWMESSDMPIHTMRDHVEHNIGMLGGMFDTDLRRRGARKRWRESWKLILKDNLFLADRKTKGSDQTILQIYIWEKFAKSLCLQHDSYLCHRFRINTIGWPTQRLMEPNNFVGAVVEQGLQIMKKCPPKCRRNIEWQYC